MSAQQAGGESICIFAQQAGGESICVSALYLSEVSLVKAFLKAPCGTSSVRFPKYFQ